MQAEWNNDIKQFISLCNEKDVKMLMVGGGAVNFHGYQRHSADIDFWIDSTNENFDKLKLVFIEMGFDFNDFPEEVKENKQNISVKFSPVNINIELITKFSINKTFDEALKDSIEAKVDGLIYLKWRVLSFEDLVTSKIKSGRPKDLADIQELVRIKNFKNE